MTPEQRIELRQAIKDVPNEVKQHGTNAILKYLSEPYVTKEPATELIDIPESFIPINRPLYQLIDGKYVEFPLYVKIDAYKQLVKRAESETAKRISFPIDGDIIEKIMRE